MGGFRQTEFEANKGNALQACVATMFQEPTGLSGVPNFIAQPDVYQSLAAYAQTKGTVFMKVMLDTNGQMPECITLVAAEGTPCLVAGISPRSSKQEAPHRHVVVGKLNADNRTVQYVFDPHPSDEYLVGAPIWAGFFIKTLM